MTSVLQNLRRWLKNYKRRSRVEKVHELESQLQGLKKQVAEDILEVSEDPVEFFEAIVGFKPTKYQLGLIGKFRKNQFVAARWCRQSGKSWIIAALLLWYAITHDDSHVAVVGPSLRQAKYIIRRITYFLKKLPSDRYERPRARIHCVSAMSIGEVEIGKGREKPIGITINMTNSAGVFQVEEILYKKLTAGVAGKFIEISAQTVPEKQSIDERIVYKITVEKDKFVHTR